jgi:hypothetical protein
MAVNMSSPSGARVASSLGAMLLPCVLAACTCFGISACPVESRLTIDNRTTVSLNLDAPSYGFRVFIPACSVRVFGAAGEPLDGSSFEPLATLPPDTADVSLGYSNGGFPAEGGQRELFITSEGVMTVYDDFVVIDGVRYTFDERSPDPPCAGVPPSPRPSPSPSPSR